MRYSDALRNTNRDSIIKSSEIDEILGYIKNQIKNPFTVDVNYFKPLRKKVDNEEDMIIICRSILGLIDEEYPSMSFDLPEENKEFIKFTYNIYKFFIKNIGSIVYIFLKEYIANAKNRKAMVSPYIDAKLESYPKEQYGKKENYILLTKINSIVKDIKNADIDFSDFINYINKANDSAAYIDIIGKKVDSSVIIDDGIVKDIMKKFIKSDEYKQVINKLSVWINTHIIVPCLVDLGYGDMDYTIFEEEEPVLDNSDEDESYE